MYMYCCKKVALSIAILCLFAIKLLLIVCSTLQLVMGPNAILVAFHMDK